MRREHFETLRPVCPVCRASRGEEVPLAVAAVFREEDGHLVEGALRCTASECQREYPVIDGVPILVPAIRAWAGANLDAVVAREDLDPATESLLGDCAGPGSAFDAARQRLSTYAWDHWADLDPEEPRDGAGPAPGSALAVLERGLALLGDLPPGPVLDLGCAAGRTTFALAARLGRPALGADLDFAGLRLAARVLREGRVRYPRRRVGLAYDRREFAVAPAGAGEVERVDFWASDAAALPFPAGTFAAIAALHLLDCVASPVDLLAALARALAPGGKAVLATPYDWSAHATPVEGWLGGHSQRGPDRGASEPVLRRLVTPGAHPAAVPGLAILAEEEALPWRVRLHDRSAVDYRVHLLILAKTGS